MGRLGCGKGKWNELLNVHNKVEAVWERVRGRGMREVGIRQRWLGQRRFCGGFEGGRLRLEEKVQGGCVCGCNGSERKRRVFKSMDGNSILHGV